MATWHQQRANVRLYHDTMWTVIEDPPNRCRTGTLCDTKQEAEEYMARRAAQGGTHLYILKPATRVRP